MKYEDFYNQCITFGDQSLPETDRWKSIKYLNVQGQSKAAIDVQSQLIQKNIHLEINNYFKGFVIKESSSIGSTQLPKSIVTFIPIEMIHSMHFKSAKRVLVDIDSLINDNSSNYK